MSRIDEEMTDNQDELDILIHHKMSKTANGRCKSNVTINDYRRSHDAKKQMMLALRGDDTAGRQHEMHGRTDQVTSPQVPPEKPAESIHLLVWTNYRQLAVAGHLSKSATRAALKHIGG